MPSISGTFDDVVKCTSRLAHIADFDCFNCATQPVESVLGDGIKVEIDAIARARG